MMNKENNILDGSKVLAIEDGNARPEFIEELDEVTEGYKLKYYLWLSRLFIVLAVSSLLLMTSASLALFKLAPMVSVEPFLMISQDTSEGIVRDEPISYDMSSREKMMETFIRQYIIFRNTIINDPIEMRSRWLPGGIVNFLSSDEVFDAFFRQVSSTWEDIFKMSLVREVEIISIGRLGGPRSPVWKVDFRTYDMYEVEGRGVARETTLKTRYWTASVTPYFIQDRMFMGRRLINPLGFTVTRYSQAEVEIF